MEVARFVPVHSDWSDVLQISKPRSTIVFFEISQNQFPFPEGIVREDVSTNDLGPHCFLSVVSERRSCEAVRNSFHAGPEVCQTVPPTPIRGNGIHICPKPVLEL